MPLDEAVADRDLLIRALQQLPHGQRAVIVLRFWHPLSGQESAHAQGNSAGTVKSQTSCGQPQRGDLLDVTTVRGNRDHWHTAETNSQDRT